MFKGFIGILIPFAFIWHIKVKNRKGTDEDTAIRNTGHQGFP